MGKPSFKLFVRLEEEFRRLIRREGLKYEIVPYFISAHPGCTMKEMEALSKHPALRGVRTEQVQDFTPTPMTVSTEIWYSGLHPYTLKPCYCAHSAEEKLRQRAYFFWYQPENVPKLRSSLIKLGRKDLADRLFGGNGTHLASNNRGGYGAPSNRGAYQPGPRGNMSQNKSKPNRYDRGSRSNPRGK
jgi:hypothetical protein